MSVALSEFWSRLVQSGIADTSGCKRIAAAFSESHSGSPPEDASSLAQFLVRARLITPFQSSSLLDDDPAGPANRRLRHLEQCFDETVNSLAAGSNRGFPGWPGTPDTVFCCACPWPDLNASRQTWLRVHAKISSNGIQPIELSGGAQAKDAEKTVTIFSPIPRGVSLWQELQQGTSLGPKRAARLGASIASELQKLHAHSGPDGNALAHGAIACDHIWLKEKGDAILLRDPSSPPPSPHDDPSASWIERIEPTAAYAAPELATGGTRPTPQSDIYSLGLCPIYCIDRKPTVPRIRQRPALCAASIGSSGADQACDTTRRAGRSDIACARLCNGQGSKGSVPRCRSVCGGAGTSRNVAA